MRSYLCNPMKVGIDLNTPRQCKECKRVLPVSMFSHTGSGYYVGECNECRALHNKEQYHKEKDILSDKYWVKRIQALRQNAEKRGLSFTITIEDLRAVYDRQKGLCWYTGLPLVIGSVDRIDIERGYLPDNIIMCERYINVFRGDMSRDDFIELCRKIASYHPL